ncbi:MAG: hypothetical protein AABX79_02165, partial [Nanoarchaeota archaeon]
MSGSVWYISVSKKKIEFKKYPKRKKKRQVFNKRSGRNKALLINILFFSVVVLFSGFISAADINDTFHINVQTTFSNGTIESGTFTFAFNITENSSSSCLGPVVYNHSTSQTTDSRGIVSIYLPTIGSGGGNLSSLSFDKQYYLCYYRDSTLKNVSQLGRVPYSFRATQVNLSEIDIDSNLTLGSFNVSGTAGFFTFLGSLTNRITSLFVQNINASGDINISGIFRGNGSGLTNVNADLLDGRDSTFFMPLNTSVSGNFDFNGGWQTGGLSISGGDIYAQTGYFINITSLNVSHLNINGSLIPQPDNQFDLGNATFRWRNLSVGTNAVINGTLIAGGLITGNNGLTISSGTVSLPSGEIGASEIAASSINTTHIIEGTILAGDIAVSAINTTHIVQGTILAGDVAASAINTTQILDNTILAIDLSSDVNATIDLRELTNTSVQVWNTIDNGTFRKLPNVTFIGNGTFTTDVCVSGGNCLA